MFEIGDVVRVIGVNDYEDDLFLGMSGEVIGYYENNKRLCAVKFYGPHIQGMHGCDELDLTKNSRYFGNVNLEIVNREEMKRRKRERKLKREKYKHIDPFEEEIW